MDAKTNLVIMAAGMGSRFGGLKQMMPVDPYGHSIIDYSIYDAIRAGFTKVVCIIKPELEAAFHVDYGKRLSSQIDLAYAYQTLDKLPVGFSVPDGRTKPWGTGHAVLCAKDEIDAPFAVINADDFYGQSAFSTIHRFLTSPHEQTEHAMVGYHIENTLSPLGSVSRGICAVDAQGNLSEIIERTHIEMRPGGAAYKDADGNFVFAPDGTIVSMNLWGFQHMMLDEIENRFPIFLKEKLPTAALTCEYYLPMIPDQLIHEKAATIQVLSTPEKWYGMTYKDDMKTVSDALAQMRRQGVYPERLWS